MGRRGRRVIPSTSVIGGYLSYVTGMHSGSCCRDNEERDRKMTYRGEKSITVEYS
jgi:hypothetical protein